MDANRSVQAWEERRVTLFKSLCQECSAPDLSVEIHRLRYERDVAQRTVFELCAKMSIDDQSMHSKCKSEQDRLQRRLNKALQDLDDARNQNQTLLSRIDALAEDDSG